MIEREQSGDITTLRLAHGKASALDTELCTAIADALRAEASSPARAVILTGSGSIFCAGVDLFRMTEGGADYVAKFLPALDDAFLTLFTFPKPVVAAVNGHAIAGGCLLAAACDRRIMASGRIGVPELLVGVPFPSVAIEILRFAAGRHAEWLAYGGHTITGEDAQAIGLIDEIAAPDQLHTRAALIATQLGSIPAENFAITKKQLRSDAVDRIERLRDLDRRSLEIWSTPETHARIREYLGRTVGKR